MNTLYQIKGKFLSQDKYDNLGKFKRIGVKGWCSEKKRVEIEKIENFVIINFATDFYKK